MKKTILLAAMLLMALGVKAQDTLVSLYPKSNCYYNYWLHSGAYTVSGNFIQGSHHLVSAVFFDTKSKDGMPVYGIAAALTVSYSSLLDNTLDSSYEHWGIYYHEADTLRLLGDSLYVNPAQTPISYYYHTANPTDTFFNETFAVYEKYYDHPVYVSDSFYVGTTAHTWKEVMIDSGPDSGQVTYAHPKVLIISYQEPDIFRSPVRLLFKSKDSETGDIEYTYWNNDLPYGMPQFQYPYFFPILTPPEHTPTDTIPSDTTHVDTTHIDTTHIDTTQFDTVGIAMRLLERYVNLQPNPAAERVLVTSSFGLQQLEVYNAAGAKVHEQKATGYSATLDVDALPAGPYLVRIATPSGTVTKKLVVQRR